MLPSGAHAKTSKNGEDRFVAEAANKPAFADDAPQEARDLAADAYEHLRDSADLPRGAVTAYLYAAFQSPTTGPLEVGVARR